MTPAELNRQPFQYLGTTGIVRDPEPAPPYLYVAGICGGDAFCVGLTLNGNTIERLPDESWDELLARCRRDPELRGDPSNIAVCIYSPHVAPKPVLQYSGRFQPQPRGW